MGFIRVLLALIVLVSHTNSFFGLNFIGGTMAVQAFYIISGFYMALVLNEKYIGVNKSYKLFITNRLIRLYPIYWVVLFLIIASSLLFALLTKGDSYALLNNYINNFEMLSPLTLIIFVFSNIFIFLQDTLLFFEINPNTGLLFFQPRFGFNSYSAFNFALIPQAWTVSLELLFYLLAPFIVRRKVICIFALFVFILIFRIIFKYYLGFDFTPWNFRFFPIELTYFLAGVLSYKLYNLKLVWNVNSRLASLIMCFVISYILFYDFIDFPLQNQLFFVVFFMSLPFVFNLTKKSKFDRYIGELSYPIYVIHFFIIALYKYAEGYFKINECIMVMIISIIASVILKYSVSDKVEKYRQRRVK